MSSPSRRLRNPFAITADRRIVGVDEVPRGADCGCFCLNCEEPLIARKGDEVVHHFAHHSDGGCGSGSEESALHKAAKNVLVSSPGKGIALGIGGYRCRLDSAEQEKTIPNSPRRGDVLAMISYTRGKTGQLYRAQAEYTGLLNIEICMYNPKDDQYAQEMSDVGIPVHEKPLSLDRIRDIQANRRVTLVSALRACLLSENSGHWLSVAGLPYEIAASIDCYKGPPHAALNIASWFFRNGDIEMSKFTLIRLARRKEHWDLDSNRRWTRGAALITDADKTRTTCRLCLGPKKEAYDTCWYCYR